MVDSIPWAEDTNPSTFIHGWNWFNCSDEKQRVLNKQYATWISRRKIQDERLGIARALTNALDCDDGEGVQDLIANVEAIISELEKRGGKT